MCGIVGYLGYRKAQPILIQALKRLEYRGYDSCGIAIQGGGLKLCKDVGRIGELEKEMPALAGEVGIGHTRWATHGKPSRLNAHPHLDCRGRIAVVHNGIIENFQSLKEKLIQEGHGFLSETDTEVIPHLIEKYYQGDLGSAVAKALALVKGSFAIAVMEVETEELVVARKDSPLVLGLGDGEGFVASDVPALLDWTDRVIYLEDGDLGVIRRDGIRIWSQGREVQREVKTVSWNLEEAEKAGYEHFMLKEIHEQPQVIRNTFRGFLSSADEVEMPHRWDGVGSLEQVLFLACGTSFHAALVGRQLMEQLGGIPARAELASEFNYSYPVLRKTWAIGITQSGETADTLKALRKAREKGCRTLALTNVVGSSATRLADRTLYIRAGPEISVAATKSFVAQLVALYMMAFSTAALDPKSQETFLDGIRLLPAQVQQILDQEERIVEVAKYLSGFEHVFLIARGLNYPIALEGALKLKEISYIHATGYPAGELKHGPFALLTPQTPVIVIAAPDHTYNSVLSSIKEVKAREAPVIALATSGDQEIEKYVDIVLRVPEVDPMLSPVVNTIPLQLLAYYAARARECPIDMPRNLAKSVTVE